MAFKGGKDNEDCMGRKFVLFKPDSDLVGLELREPTRTLMFTRSQLVDLLAYYDDKDAYYTGKAVGRPFVDNTGDDGGF